MPTFRDYKSQRPNRILYETITFYHSTFGYVRLVNMQVYPKTFAGQVYTPCRMEISESQQSSTPVINSTIRFSRLAQDFKQQLKVWRSYSRIEPITVTYRLFDSKDMTTAIKEWQLYVKDCSLDADNVNVSLSMTNPLNTNVALLYDPADWPGLEIG